MDINDKPLAALLAWEILAERWRWASKDYKGGGMTRAERSAAFSAVVEAERACDEVHRLARVNATTEGWRDLWTFLHASDGDHYADRVLAAIERGRWSLKRDGAALWPKVSTLYPIPFKDNPSLLLWMQATALNGRPPSDFLPVTLPTVLPWLVDTQTGRNRMAAVAGWMIRQRLKTRAEREAFVRQVEDDADAIVEEFQS